LQVLPKELGLGHAFFAPRVERCHVILHLVDATSSDPVADFQMLNREIFKMGRDSWPKCRKSWLLTKLTVSKAKVKTGKRDFEQNTPEKNLNKS
jgi:GTP-binding protein